METITPPPGNWSMFRKILFRFFAAYFIIYISLDTFWQYLSVLDPAMSWIARHLLHITRRLDAEASGSGDTTFNYVQEFFFVLLTVITCIIWTIIDHKKSNYDKVAYWARAFVRYYLAYVLLSYSFSKIFGGQFEEPDLGRLIQPYGTSSPMGLAWTFLGFSSGFIWFMAIFEGLGGLLMLFRRTTLFGACIATTVITNIVVINFCFDVPVKLFSSNLLLMALFILAGDLNRFLSFFVLNRPIPAVDLSPAFKSKKMKITRIVLKALFILAIFGLSLAEVFSDEGGDDNAKPALYGLYKVQMFVRNQDTIPPLNTDTTRWNRLIVSYPGYASAQMMNEGLKTYIFKPDTLHQTVSICEWKDSTNKSILSYRKEDTATLYLAGKLNGDSIWIKFHRFDKKNFLLMNRGFHWVNEYPFNR